VYVWTTVDGRAALLQAETAKPIAQFSSGPGECLYQLKVTDSQGESAADHVRVIYAGGEDEVVSRGAQRLPRSILSDRA
jgi:hypothetical protein